MAKKKASKVKTKTPKQRIAKRKSVGGPSIIGALICERILKEDSVASIIRVVDKFTVEKPTGLPTGVRVGFSTSLFISFKSGDFKGTKTARLRAVTPSGSTL